MRFSGLAVALAVFAVAPASAASGPAEAPPCLEAAALSLLGPTTAATDKLLACAQVPGQTPYKIADARFKRFGMLERMQQADLAEAELVALTTPPVSNFRVFTNSASGVMIFGGEFSIGVTQVDLLGARAYYRLRAGDKAAALELAQQATKLAGYDPAYASDAATAFMVRARLAAMDGNNDAALRLAIRAYLRGSDDEWITATINGQQPATRDQLAQLRLTLRQKLEGYDFAISAKARATQKAEEIDRVVADAKSFMTQLKVFELGQLGPV